MCSTLLELSSIIVSGLYPFALIEDAYKIVPEPVQRKIIFHSFPRDEDSILMYSNHYGNEEFKFENYKISNAIQIGFHLTGRVGVDEEEEVVSLNFERCKITSINCSCQQQQQKRLIFWCDHVVALAIWRIRFKEGVELRVPISETLQQMDKNQLQKLVQYLLSKHTEVLPSAQNLADDLSQVNSTINGIHGAPDPTAGGCPSDENSWALNEANIAEQIREIYEDNKLDIFLKGLFKKTLSMLQKSDPNGPKIAKIITVEFLTKQISRPIWDKLINIWKIIAMDPTKTIQTRIRLYQKVLRNLSNNEEQLKDCLDLLATDYAKQSNNLVDNCLRVQALNHYGYFDKAITLALAILSEQNTELSYEHVLMVCKVFKQNNLESKCAEFGLKNLAMNRVLNENNYELEKMLRFEEKVFRVVKITEINFFVKQFLSNCYSNCLPLFNLGKFLYKINQNNNTFKLAVKFLKMNIPSCSIQANLEHQQVNLALLLINSNKQNKCNLETILKSLTTIKSITSVFKLAQESFRLEESNSNLINFSYNLGLHVLKASLKYPHRRRWDIVRWVMNSSLSCGFYQVFYLLENWGEYFTPGEAVGTVASQFVSRGTSLRLNLNYHQITQLSTSARKLSLLAMRLDPTTSLNGLTICESDLQAFEACYQIIIESATKQQINSQQIFTIARYVHHRNHVKKAYNLGVVGIGQLYIPFNQETHSGVADIHWTCQIAQSLGDTELSNLLPLIISNIKCASVLAEILKRAALEPPRKYNQHNKIYARLKLLVEATINSYVSTVHNRLMHISPRHYSDFIEYVSKAKECFMFAPEGGKKFQELINDIKGKYKGKKKLLLLIVERFG